MGAEILKSNAERCTDADGELLLLAALPRLSRVAEQLAKGTPRVDPQDLLSEAVARLYSLWRRGCGPRDNIVAYVSVSMRNSLKDEWKRRRSQEVPLPPDWDRTDDSHLLLDAVEAYRENGLLLKALRQLPDDQRTVLLRSALLSEKPRHLAAVVNRPAPAVSSLLQRARITLRRGLVREFLADGAVSQECRDFAQAEVAVGFADSLLTSLPDTGHHRSCGACAAALNALRAHVADATLPENVTHHCAS